MENPWKTITWEHPFAECDEAIIRAEKYKDKLQIDNTLPEPYVGSLKSNVVCLNGNPGRIDNSFTNKELFVKELISTLRHCSNNFMWLSEELETTNHCGVRWWEQITRSLRAELGFSPQLLVLEYFPYHSARMFNFPKLPSDRYRNYLLKKAMKEGKLIVIMRAKSRWYQIKEDRIGQELEEYNNKIILHNPRRVYLTKNNMGDRNWERFLNALKQ